MLKKILFYFFICCGIGVSFGFDTLSIEDLNPLKTYNIEGKNVNFIGYFEYSYGVRSDPEAILTFENIDNGKVIDVFESQQYLDENNCTKLSSKLDKYIESFDVDKLLTYPKKNTLIGKPVLDCFYNDQYYIVPSTELMLEEVIFLNENYFLIGNHLKKILEESVGDELLESIYKYVMNYTSYDYEFADISHYFLGFIRGKNVVCEGYVKALKIFANYLGIEFSSVLGRKQSIDRDGETLHVWLKKDGSYYDPTFDDTGDRSGLNYYNKSKRCFNFTHFTPGWLDFDSKEDRFNYFLVNEDFLINECPGIVFDALILDGYLPKLVNYFYFKKDLDGLKKLFCDNLGLCGHEMLEFDDYVDSLKLLKVKLSTEQVFMNIAAFFKLDFYSNLKDIYGYLLIEDSNIDKSIKLALDNKLNVFLLAYSKKYGNKYQDQLISVLDGLKGLSFENAEKQKILDYIIAVFKVEIYK